MSELAAALERAAAAAQAFVDELEAPLLDEADERHLLKVRRLRDGELVVAADGRGSWRRCRLVGRRLEPVGEIEHEPPPSAPRTVAFAPVKGDRSEWAVAKLTELGIDRILALSTERAAVRWEPEAAERALSRWRRVAREAACQSRRLHLPDIAGLIDFGELRSQGAAMACLGGEGAAGSLRTVLVGPEGGWSPEEAASEGPTVGLGGLVLRTETAAVAAGALLAALDAGTVAPMAGREEG